MNFKSILNTVTTASGFLMPAATPLLAMVNSLVSDDKKLPENATAVEIKKAYDSLPTGQRKTLDTQAQERIAEIQASTDKLQAMVSVENANSNTRPRIAYIMAILIVIISLTLAFSLAWSVITKDAQTLATIKDLWPLALALIGTPSALLRAYFGMRTQEKKARYSAATGMDVSSGIGGMIKGMLGK